MLKFKLARVGKTKAPEYRIVVVEHTKDPYGDFVEKVGNYNPRTSPSTVTLKTDRVEYWLSQGVQPTDTVRNIFIGEGLIKEDKKAKAVALTDKRRAKLAEKQAEAEEAKKAAEEAAKEAEEAVKAEAEAAAAAEEAPAEEAAPEAPAEEAPAEAEAPAEEKTEEAAE